MKTILVIGAGRSSSSLIRYLLSHAQAEGWQVRVGDADLSNAQARVGAHERGTAFQFDINDAVSREHEIAAATLVVSMLPAFMHGSVAKDCVRLGKHLVTASYVSDEMRALDEEAKQKGIILLNEIGLDPGIDHLSAMQVIDRVHEAGGMFESFHSYCGGLVAPESNDNPWGYKFSWNPRNVILAGQGTAQYIDNRTYKYLPYNRLFAQAKTVEVVGHGKFDAYANRDSLSYRAPYQLTEIPTMLRGTLRQEGYCAAWNVFVQLGLTDDSWKIKQASQLTYANLVDAFLPVGTGSLKTRLAAFMGMAETDPMIEKIAWTGILSDEQIGLKEASPAQILQELLERKWLLKKGDKDMIVMLHQFEYILHGKKHKLDSSL
ncbi:MAG: saccharopine dehydrogenase family protein, partial [Bacteroidia bacterium]